MSTRLRTVVATCNLRFTLSAGDFEAGLRKVLAHDPDICAVQEALDHRDPIIERVCRDLGYAWARAKGGEPILWKISRYGKAPRWVKGIRLARAEFVGHIPGRKDRLPVNVATEVGLDDLASTHPDGAVTVANSYHLTAEVQDVHGGGGYKKDHVHVLRVLRHIREKFRLGHRMRLHKRRGRTAYGTGDGNFAGMLLRGFVSCWTNRHGGTLGGRAVDIIFAATRGSDLVTVVTLSDHDGLVVTYP